MTNGGTLKIGSSFTAPYIGTFAPGSGTIEYTGSGNRTILNTNSLGSQAYNNLVLSGTGTKTAGNNSYNVLINGNLTVASNAKLTVSSQYYLVVNGNISNSGTITLTAGIYYLEVEYPTILFFSGNFTNNSGATLNATANYTTLLLRNFKSKFYQ